MNCHCQTGPNYDTIYFTESDVLLDCHKKSKSFSVYVYKDVNFIMSNNVRWESCLHVLVEVKMSFITLNEIYAANRRFTLRKL